MSRLCNVLGLFGMLLFSALAAAAEQTDAEGIEFFEKQIRPLLVQRCQKCHGSDDKAENGLQLTSRSSILKGGDTGPAAVPGKPAESTLVRAIGYAGELRMPPDTKLPQREIDLLTRWVERGLPWPAEKAGPAVVRPSGEPFKITAEQRQFWSFQPLRAAAIPAVVRANWPQSNLDRFILARLESSDLAPVAPADKRALLRRATFDLTGLPPTPDEVAAFVNDDSPGAFAKIVDRLLESPHYGQRWARHWLDVVRYADSVDARQLGQPGDISEAYRYRDWVVDAFNNDYPYDRFVADQIAGDLLHTGDAEQFAAGLTATSMLAIGRWEQGEADKEKMVTDIVDDQIDVVGRGFLGLTLACARCHDHKFDPIGTEDYYSLAGIFFSSSILPDPGAKAGDSPRLRLPLTSPRQQAEQNERRVKVTQIEREVAETLQRRRTELSAALVERLDEYLLAAIDVGRPGAPATNPTDRPAMDPVLVARLAAWLGVASNSPPHLAGLLTEKLVVVNPQSGIVGWGSQATPWIAANPGDNVARAGSLSVPPRSVAVHPSPDKSAAIGWSSPFGGQIAITGIVSDGDATCGNGAAWTVELWRHGKRSVLAEGRFVNGGQQELPTKPLAAIDVEWGDLVSIVVHAGDRNHACDTTTVELVIREMGAERRWSIATDLAPNLQEANPHADQLGNRDVWFCYATGSTAAPGVPDGSALARWAKAVRERPTREALEALTGDASRVTRNAPPDMTTADGKTRLALVDPAGPVWNGFDVTGRLEPAARQRIDELRAELAVQQRELSQPQATVHGIREGGVPQTVHAGIHDAAIHVRGRYDRLGAVVPRRLPRILAGENQPPITRESGRRELAQWIASPDNPLTARVMANRIWLAHFGQGLVRTPGNFGRLGQPPTHPELLDWLAQQFIDSGWSIKSLHRTLMLSATYQLASQPSAELIARDPDNRLFGHMHRRRLDAESVRDSLLAVAGRLDPARGGPATRDFNSPRRTLYVMTIRSDRSTFRDLFDAADPTAMVDQRNNTTVAPQALFMLNHPFVIEQSKQLAGRTARLAGDDRVRIGSLYELLYGRRPTNDETAASVAILDDFRRDAPATAWEAYCQVLLCANEFIYIE